MTFEILVFIVMIVVVLYSACWAWLYHFGVLGPCQHKGNVSDNTCLACGEQHVYQRPNADGTGPA